ncbi:NAD(P)H-quinone oxidoreductase [Azospirillum brasilense]|uniref:NAD(P)H-quinone oxidoreductase n=1 Tax=Azospirillum brasilense TaxID=192 RepID=UPI000E6824F6|nr:NAD(P)H-quinone oxidoreductase [Azospirillum brasilense]NUB23968.1 zinc-binding dehydrogenase [Azospirillum brasilense]NUB31041.1 zinc-binding dehydrogenase [Azospirillum brasilense]RIW01901.1 NAD(P)H-quinone oxidoreductase [Azospirillum brasilense]
MGIALPDSMTCVEISQPGGPEVLRTVQRPAPVPGPGEVLVAVEAAGVNRPDMLQRQGRYDPPPGASDLPGLEIAGRVVALGEGVTEWAADDAVCALISGGGYAQYCVVPAPQLLPVPKGYGMVEAAAVPETFFTVWTNVFERGALKPGETLLVHGGSSGIGTTAIQLAKAFGAKVFTTAGSAEKCRACEELGADRAIDYKTEDFAAVIQKETGGRGVDVVLDMVGGDYIARDIGIMAPDGRHVSIAFLQGPKVSINMFPVMTKRLTLTGSTLRARSVEEKGRIAAALREKVWPLLEAGTVKPVIHKVFTLEQASEAHALMESSAHIGKIVMTVGG